MPHKIKHLFLIVNVVLSQAIADDTPILEKVIVEGVVPPGNGLMLPQQSPQAGSVVSRSAIEQKNTLNNVYQAMDLLPGINTYSYDATGLFGGGLRMRGFNSDQIGVSVDGAPINDAGNFAVYPSELVDLENLEEITVTQGSNQVDAPMVGATGGSIGMRTASPTDQARLRVQQSYGAFNAYKTFLRADTGYLADNRFKAFISVSKAEADKWKGYGSADREHLDFKGVLNLGAGSSITGGLLYNQLFNNNIRTLTLAEIQTKGRQADFSGFLPARAPATSNRADIETVSADSYYDLSLNPYRNYLATLQGRFQLSQRLRLEIDPYYNYGYGLGGNELRTLAESSGLNKIGGGIRDINGDGDTKDTLMVYSGAVTETQRPGVTARLRGEWGRHRLMTGYWFEYAHHRRTQPAVAIDAAGQSVDPWLDNPSLFLLRKNGTPFQGRDFLTLNTSQSFFGQDDIGFLDNKLVLTLGMRYTQMWRDFFNYASEGYTTAYNVKASYERPLPNAGIRYQFTEHQQLFASGAENFKVPPDSVFYGLANKSGGINSINVQEEVSTNWDAGYRYSSKDFSFSGTLFYIDYRNRIASAFDPINNTTTNYNVGDSTTKGIELESAWRFQPNWSVYGSFTYTHSRMNEDLQLQDARLAKPLPTAGKAFPDVPNWMAGAALQYRDGPWSANLSAKYTGKRYSTLLNDQSMSGYTLVSFDAGYRLPSTGWFKDPMLRLNVYNLLDADYLNLNGGSGSGFTVAASNNPSYYIGAPRSFTVSLSSDF